MRLKKTKQNTTALFQLLPSRCYTGQQQSHSNSILHSRGCIYSYICFCAAMNAQEPVSTQAKMLINVPYLFGICSPRLIDQIKVNNPPSPVPKARGASNPACSLPRNSLNEFFLMSSLVFLFSPPCLPTDILSCNSSVTWRATEGAQERVGGRREGWRERMKSLFRHQKAVLGDRGEYADSSMCFLMMPLCFMNSMVHNSGSRVFSPLLLLLFLPSFTPPPPKPSLTRATIAH